MTPNQNGRRRFRRCSGAFSSAAYHRSPFHPPAAEYAKIRARDEKKKADNYQKNVQKAFKFEDFTQFYLKRGTSEGGNWLKAPARGHRMAKTKYDYSGDKIEDNKLPEAFKFK